MNNKILAIIIILCSFLSWILGSYFYGQTQTSQNISLQWDKIIKNNKTISITDLENEVTDIVEKISPSVVNIIINKDLVVYKNDPFNFFRQPVWSINRKVWGGTGFFITKDGTILTNKHVISDRDANYTVILQNGNEYPATVLAIDPLTDLAVIKIESKDDFIPLEFIWEYSGKNSEIKIWQFAIAIWNALAEFQNSVALWVISWTNRTIEAQWDTLSGLLQTDAAINPGNSGWPLVNTDGKVMWINTAISWNAQWIWFSIPLSTSRVDFILDSIEKYWEIKKPFIGINYRLLIPEISKELWINSDYWAYILEGPNSIVKNSSAQKAWLQPWDVITHVDGIKITPTNDLISFIQNKIPGETLEINILRKNQKITKFITLGLEN